jgi:metal-sulfur cluster biosynthetic enzyme
MSPRQPTGGGGGPGRPTRTRPPTPTPPPPATPAVPPPALDVAQIRRVAGGVKDPEVRTTLADLGLLDEVEVDEGGRVTVRFHLTSPLCPARFAGQIGQEIRRRVARLPGVVSVEVVLGDHFMAQALHQLINHGNHTTATRGVLG